MCEIQHAVLCCNNAPSLAVVDAVLLQMAATKNPTSELHSAAQCGYTDMVSTILAEGASINLGNESGSTPVYLASRWGHLGATKLLLQHGANLHLTADHRWTPLHAASIHGYLAICLVLLKAGADVHKVTDQGATPLIVAADGGHAPVAKALIRAGAHLDTQQPGNGETALYTAACKGHLGVVRELFRAGANAAITTSGGHTPVEVATSNGHCQIVKEFLDLGEERYGGSAVGIRAFTIAATRDRVDILALLRDSGITDDSGGTAIINAARFDCRNTVHFLLTYCGSDARAHDGIGNSALMYAAANGNPRLAQLLLEAGADETIDQRGSGPMECTYGKINTFGTLQKGEEADPGRMAVRRLLQQAPATRAVSWLWSVHPTQEVQIDGAIPKRPQAVEIQRKTIWTKQSGGHFSAPAASMLRRVTTVAISFLIVFCTEVMPPQSVSGLDFSQPFLPIPTSSNTRAFYSR